MAIVSESRWPRSALLADLEAVRFNRPLIHNITNFVVMDLTANALLALGASPAMAHAQEEVAEMTGIAAALVLNIGTLEPGWVTAMAMALEAARRNKTPVVLDPVAAGATRYRTQVARDLIIQGPPTILRSNAAELAALAAAILEDCPPADSATRDRGQKGVDSTLESLAMRGAALRLARHTGMVICVSGAVDLITDGDRLATVHHGDPMMTRVTGLGCTASAVTGAFAAINPDPFIAAIHAMAIMGLAGERARSSAPGSFRANFIDALYQLDSTTLPGEIDIRLEP